MTRTPTGSMHSDLMRRMREAGLPLEHAYQASAIALRVTLDRRDAMIRTGYRQGYSIRQLSRLWGISKSHVQRLVAGVPSPTPQVGQQRGASCNLDQSAEAGR